MSPDQSEESAGSVLWAYVQVTLQHSSLHSKGRNHPGPGPSLFHGKQKDSTESHPRQHLH